MPDYQAIAREINKARDRLGERTARSDMAFDILAMKIAKQFGDDPAFNRYSFATTAGIPGLPTQHLVSS